MFHTRMIEVLLFPLLKRELCQVPFLFFWRLLSGQRWVRGDGGSHVPYPWTHYTSPSKFRSCWNRFCCGDKSGMSLPFESKNHLGEVMIQHWYFWQKISLRAVAKFFQALWLTSYRLAPGLFRGISAQGNNCLCGGVNHKGDAAKEKRRILCRSCVGLFCVDPPLIKGGRIRTIFLQTAKVRIRTCNFHVSPRASLDSCTMNTQWTGSGGLIWQFQHVGSGSFVRV